MSSLSSPPSLKPGSGVKTDFATTGRAGFAFQSLRKPALQYFFGFVASLDVVEINSQQVEQSRIKISM